MKSLSVSLVAVTVLATCAVGCSATKTQGTTGDGGSEGGTLEAGTTQPIVIGVNLALTGGLASFGQAQQQAVKVAETQINAFGGVLGRRVQYEIKDDGSDTAKSKANTKEFIDLKVPVYIGTTGSPQVSDVAAMLFEAKIAAVSPSASTPVMRTAQPAKDRYFFRTAASHGLQARALALKATKGIAGGAACTKIALVHADDSYGKPIAEGIKAQAERLNAQIARVTSVPTQVKADYSAEVNEVLAANPGCLIIVTFPDVGIGFMRKLKKANRVPAPSVALLAAILGSNGLRNTAGFLTAGRLDPADPASPTIGEGMHVLNFDLNPPTPEYAAFKNIFTAQFPLKADQPDLVGYTANAFDAAIIVALAMEQAKSATDAVAIRDALFAVSKGGAAYGPDKLSEAIKAIKSGADIDYNGASGPVDFDDYGDVLADFVVEKVEAGKYKKVDGIAVKDLPSD